MDDKNLSLRSRTLPSDETSERQMILVSDENGNFTGEYIPKMVGHRGEGKRHLAITVLLVNSRGEVLLQKRKHQIFDYIWDLTGATHPLHLPDGSDESLEQATLRCLKREYGIDKVEVKNLGAFNYFARYGKLCENEHCAVMVGEYDGPINLNPKVGYEYKWVDEREFLKDINHNPQNYTPWAKEAVKILEAKGFFN